MFTTKKQVLLTMPVDIIFPPPYEGSIQGTGALLAVLHSAHAESPGGREKGKEERFRATWAHKNEQLCMP